MLYALRRVGGGGAVARYGTSPLMRAYYKFTQMLTSPDTFSLTTDSDLLHNRVAIDPQFIRAAAPRHHGPLQEGTATPRHTTPRQHDTETPRHRDTMAPLRDAAIPRHHDD